jgi:hypothetical protein
MEAADMKFNPLAFTFALVLAGAGIGGHFLGLARWLELALQSVAVIGLCTVAYYQTRRLD